MGSVGLVCPIVVLGSDILVEVIFIYLKTFKSLSIMRLMRSGACKRHIEMTPLCNIEVTLPRVLGSRGVRRGGVVDEQAGVQPS